MSRFESTQPITRRRSLALFGAAAGGLLLGDGLMHGHPALARTVDGDDHVADAASACTLIAEQELGPYYVALDRVRSDVTLGQAGVPLQLQITLINTRTCKPLRDAAVDIWSCNASGIYSDISAENTYGQTYLRGVQITDKHGQVNFRTIFPGHYSGRTTHIHLRVHLGFAVDGNTISGGHISHTGQMFPSQAVYTEVYKLAPYSAETATIVTHAEDRVWTAQHGSEALMKIEQLASRLSKGLQARVTLGVNPSATPAVVGPDTYNPV
jgi:protocatechuate 3,4-dioxygenase beta subunit